MPPAPVPPAVDKFLTAPNPAVIATLREDGSPHTAATWYDWEDGRVLVSMDRSRRRLRHMRRDPRVSLTVIDRDDWYRHITLTGDVVQLRDDDGLADIDRLAHRYLGTPYITRDSPRVSAWVRVAAWHGWDAAGARGVTDASWHD